MAQLPRCAVCRTTLEVRQVVAFRTDGRVQHVQCPHVVCLVCDRPVLPTQPIRRERDRLVHANCWMRRAWDAEIGHRGAPAASDRRL